MFPKLWLLDNILKELNFFRQTEKLSENIFSEWMVVNLAHILVYVQIYCLLNIIFFPLNEDRIVKLSHLSCQNIRVNIHIFTTTHFDAWIYRCVYYILFRKALLLRPNCFCMKKNRRIGNIPSKTLECPYY